MRKVGGFDAPVHRTQTFIGKEPDLQSSNDLPVGRKAQGWVSFEVPKNVEAFEIVESRPDGYLRWLATEP